MNTTRRGLISGVAMVAVVAIATMSYAWGRGGGYGPGYRQAQLTPEQAHKAAVARYQTTPIEIAKTASAN